MIRETIGFAALFGLMYSAPWMIKGLAFLIVTY